jgi:DNA-binding GntR family transcriptional regulator
MATAKFDLRDIDAEHKAIMEAALSRDLAAATRLLAEHINLTSDYLRGAMSAISQGDGKEDPS